MGTMAATPPQTISYQGNRTDGNAIAFMGHIYGDVSLSDSPRPDQCLRDLRITDPWEDKQRIEAGKDRLLKDCYAWILDNADFRCWRDCDDSKLLWIKGDPGKGKTMMMIALVEELSGRPTARIRSEFLSQPRGELKANPPSSIVSYFFCQSTDSRLNNAVSVLKGLISLLVTQKRDLIGH